MIEEVLEEQKKPRINMGELVEELIVEATGGTTDYFKAPVQPDLEKKKTLKSKQKAEAKYKKDMAKHQLKVRLRKDNLDKVKQSVSQTDQISGKRLQKLEAQKLPAEGVYAKFGVKSGIPKTDLIDAGGSLKYSAKASAGAQFVSAQGPESAALWYVSLEQAAGGKDFNPAVTNAINSVPEKIKEYFDPKNFVNVKKSGKENLQKYIKQIYNEIFNVILESIGVKDAFMKQFYIEGMTGNVKFNNGVGAADTMLSWNLDGKPFEIKDIIGFIDANLGQLNVRVSDRGHERGGAIRGDIRKRTLQEDYPSAAAQKFLRKNVQQMQPDDEEDTQQKLPAEGAIEELGNRIKDNLFNIYNRRGKEVGLVDLLDYLKTGGEVGYVDMTPLWGYFGVTTSPYIPEQAEGT